METPYEYHDKKLGVKIKYLVYDRFERCFHADSLKLISYNALYKRLNSKKSTETELRRASLGCDALILHSSIAQDWKDQLAVKFGKPNEEIKKSWFAQHYIADREAYNFYIDYQYGENVKLDPAVIQKYVYQASVLNTVLLMKNNRKQYLKALGCTTVDIWESLSRDVNAFREVDHKLPTTKSSLRFKANKYAKEGYAGIISDKFGTQNALKVTSKIENLILSLYCLPNKPYVETVHEMYEEFLNGEIDVFDIKTGELFNKNDFFKRGKPVELTVATVWNYITAPHNDVIVKKARNGAYDFNHKIRPHVTRTPPVYSMSKISLDDRDIMHTKLHDGSKVMAYYAFDVMSGAMIGIAHSKSKNHELYIDCLRSMFRFTTSKGLGVPMQMEVEQHLVSDYKDGLMKAGNLFPFVRWCNATNSQEKGAEHLIGMKKYGVEKDNNQNVGRHYSRRDSNRTTIQKIFDEHNDTYKEAKASFEQIVANELQEQIAYNNELHSNQKKYKGQTRLQVFLNNINPDLPKLDLAQLTRYIGNHRETTIRRNQYVTIQYEKYQLSSPQIIRKLAPNNYEVDAYYLPNDKNEIESVYIYQNGLFICECEPKPTFNTANSEWTDNDKIGYENATKYISQFDKMVKEDSQKLQKVSIIRNNKPIIDITPEVVPKQFPEPEYKYEYVNTHTERSRAINDL
ncbi:hypothetical protein NJT12_00230 [Flavobacterium sp. AC]|uniref:Integrase catalytic domain-containing protein n=1 Tax=Flavobacterium azizsancarii TaxID=2961580 RepID=A0ABT4W620_9FLAO|nr:hypothetical protein [Flavobacterium azizsancarii]MDA6068029.1 hypothetical protein [Flavobacterium azizsancarii]